MAKLTQPHEKNSEIAVHPDVQRASAAAPEKEEVAAAANPQETEAVREKLKEFKFKRGYSPHAVDNRAGWAVSEHDAWLEKTHWTDTPVGRAGIEFVARITLGGMFYAWMQGSKQMDRMASYDPATHPDKVAKKQAKSLEKIAYFIDSTLGRGIGYLAKLRYGDATREVNGESYSKAKMVTRFRNTRVLQEKGVTLPGRSLGAEMTSVTADFAAMSAGTAIARELMLNTLNPRERKSWLDEKGNFNPLHIGKKLLAKAWEIVSYNAGEDAVVALPYVFFLRACRNTLDKVFPGFRYGSDSGVDAGGSIVVGDSGSVKSELQLAGAIDLQARFTFYNVLTQIYRDAYNGVAHKFSAWSKDNFAIKTPEWIKNPETIPSRIANSIGGTARYLAISSIRSVLQMTPSVPFFSLFRVPGSKPNGFAVHAEYGAIEGSNDGGQTWEKIRRNGKGTYTEYRWSNHELAKAHAQDNSKINLTPANPFQADNYEIFGMSKKGRPLQGDPLSRITDMIGSNLHQFAGLPIWHSAQKWFWDLTGNSKNSEKLSKNAMLAGVPYASYFAAKVYFRSYVHEMMNLAIGRMIDGVLHWNRTDFIEGINEIQRCMLGLPFRQTSRKAELIMNHKMHPEDRSPMPERWTREDHKEYLAKIAAGNEPDPYDLMEQLSLQRAAFYQDRSRIYHEAQRVKSTNTKEEILNKPKAANWEESAAERKAQIEDFVGVGA